MPVEIMLPHSKPAQSGHMLTSILYSIPGPIRAASFSRDLTEHESGRRVEQPTDALAGRSERRVVSLTLFSSADQGPDGEEGGTGEGGTDSILTCRRKNNSTWSHCCPKATLETACKKVHLR